MMRLGSDKEIGGQEGIRRSWCCLELGVSKKIDRAVV